MMWSVESDVCASVLQTSQHRLILRSHDQAYIAYNQSVSTLFQLFRSGSRVRVQTKPRITPLCYSSPSCDRHSTPKSRHPPLPSERHRESLFPEKQRSVSCVVTFSTHRTNPERAANKQLLFPWKQDGVCCCSNCDVTAMDHPLRDLCANAVQTSSSGAAHQSEAWLNVTPTQTCMCSSDVSEIDQLFQRSLNLVFILWDKDSPPAGAAENLLLEAAVRVRRQSC